MASSGYQVVTGGQGERGQANSTIWGRTDLEAVIIIMQVGGLRWTESPLSAADVARAA